MKQPSTELKTVITQIVRATDHPLGIDELIVLVREKLPEERSVHIKIEMLNQALQGLIQMNNHWQVLA